MGACDIDIHHRRVSARFGVDVLVIWIVDTHLAPVDYRRSQRLATRMVDSLVVQMVAQPCNTVAGEDAEDVSLVIVKLRRSVTAEAQEILAKEGLHTRERKVGELGAVVQQNMDTLRNC